MIKLRARGMKVAAIVALSFLFAGVGATAATADPLGKVFVCKYVGTPGDGEVFQTGNNPISVSVNTIPDYQGVGSYFGDDQGRSYVLAVDDSTGGGQSGEPDISECPPPDTGPDEVTPATLTPVDLCGVEDDTVTGVPDNGRYSDVTVTGNTQTVIFTPGDGEELGSPLPSGWTANEDGTATYSHTFTNEACPIDIELAEVEYAPTWTPICLPNNDTVTIPEVDGVTYTDTLWVGGERTITASADEGYTLLGETSWTFTDVPVAGCPDETGFSGTPKGELAYSGVSTDTNGLTALAIFLMASGTVLVALRSRAARQ